MRRVLRRTGTVLLFSVLLCTAPRLGYSGAERMEPSTADTFVEECGNRIEKWFPLITIRGQELALDQVRILQKLQVVIIPLKSPHGDVTAIRWQPKDTTGGMEFVRYLQTGKIGAINVLPFRHHPAVMYIEHRELRDKLNNCQKERIEELLGKCTECEVMEWLNVKP